MDTITRKYSNGEITVVWQPHECVHSGVCFRGLGEVFNPKKRPWISIQNASTEKIIAQVKKCPSGALSIERPGNEVKEESVSRSNSIELQQNGPIILHGEFTMKDASGVETKHDRPTALCRCGGSSNKPYCDGTHKKIGFLS